MTTTITSHPYRAPTAILLLLLASACAASDRDDSTDAGDLQSADGSTLAGSGGSGSGAGGGGGGSLADGGGSLDDASGSFADGGGWIDGGDPTVPGSVDLGTAAGFAILAKTGISTVPTSAITGDIGVSPAAASYITGFSLTADATNVFATATQVTGKVYAANYKPPTPSKMTTAISDMELAFTDAASRAPDVTELGAGNIGGMTLEPGVYKWGTGLLIPTDVTLTGSKTGVWIFQIAKDLTVSNGKKVTMAGGALPGNVYWQVSGKVTLGTTSQFQGVVLCRTAITLRTGASVYGRLLAQTAVNIDKATVVKPE